MKGKENEKEKESSNEDIKKKKDLVGFKLTEKNSTSDNHENKKEKSRSKSMAVLMKTNQIHSMLEQLIKSDTFSFQSKLAEVENEPLSLFSTTPKNTIVSKLNNYI